MIYRFISYFCMLMMTIAVGYGQQRQLHYEDKSGPFDVFTGTGSEAGMVIICAETIELTFVSNKDKTVNIFKTELKGSDKYYYLRLPVGDAYNDRKLTVYAARYAPLILEPRLQIKELKTILLYDPDVILQGCYNQTMKEGLEIFRMAQYPDAKAKYRLAAECTDAPATVIDDIEQKIAIIDTIIKRRRIADEFFTVGNYRKAYDNYQAAFAHNPGDRYVELRMSESYTKLTGKSMLTGQNSKALASLEKKYERKMERRRQRTFAMSYETLYGGSLGWYRDRKVGAYFAGRYFEGEAGAYNSVEEISASFGLTFRLFRMTAKDYKKWTFGVWMSLGAGFVDCTASQKYYSYNDFYDTAAFPEAGVLMKLGFAVLKYSYQYRFDFPGDLVGRHILGAGICF